MKGITLGKTVYVVYGDEMYKERVGYIGSTSFIVEEFDDGRIFDSLEWFYADYNKRWFTSFAKAKKALLEEGKIIYGDIAMRVCVINENSVWGLDLK